MTPTVPVPEVLTAVKVKVSPSTSVSFVITFVLVNEASSATVAVSATATGPVFEVWAFSQSRIPVVEGLPCILSPSENEREDVGVINPSEVSFWFVSPEIVKEPLGTV